MKTRAGKAGGGSIELSRLAKSSSMMLKSPNLLLPSCGNLLCSYASQFNIILPHRAHPKHPYSCRRSPTIWRLKRGDMQCRSYADVKSRRRTEIQCDSFGWPKLQSPSAIPTPYQIFQQEEGAPYSKLRFYELVKLYHPDTCSHKHSRARSLSPQVRVERYRLVVAANCILSDPAKQSAYDRFGAGWYGRADTGFSKYRSGCSSKAEWSGFKSSPIMNNATWEDWEQWYQTCNGSKRAKQEPTYVSNGGFVTLVAVVVVLGAVGQRTWIEGYSASLIKQIDMVHDSNSKGVETRRRASQQLGNRDERLESFLRTRDPYGYDIVSSRNEFDLNRSHLPAPAAAAVDESSQD